MKVISIHQVQKGNSDTALIAPLRTDIAVLRMASTISHLTVREYDVERYALTKPVGHRGRSLKCLLAEEKGMLNLREETADDLWGRGFYRASLAMGGDKK